MTRATASAERRRVLYLQRIAAAGSERARLNAIVGWLMAEWYQLPAAERQGDDTDPLVRLAKTLNGRSRS